MEVGITGPAGIDWAERWRSIVGQRTGSRGPSQLNYWDARAPSFARMTRNRKDEFIRVLEPYLSPHKTLVDAGAGAGRHAVAVSRAHRPNGQVAGRQCAIPDNAAPLSITISSPSRVDISSSKVRALASSQPLPKSIRESRTASSMSL